jgi:ABC-2 type transport system permease protein
MRICLAVALKSFQKHLAYRAANLAGIITNTFFGAVYVYVYLALFPDRAAVGGSDVRDAVTYVVLSQSLLMAMSAFGNRELSEAIMKGRIASDLARPLNRTRSDFRGGCRSCPRSWRWRSSSLLC